MLTFLLKSLGWLIAHTPEVLLRGVCVVLGELVLWIPRRRHIQLSNLHHAFPDRPRAWHLRFARESCRRLIETGLLSAASPFISNQRLRGMLQLSAEVRAYLQHQIDSPRPTIVIAAHFAYWEVLTFLGLFLPEQVGTFGVMFRPLRNPQLDAFVQCTRERFGMRLLSRKNGFQDALRILRGKGTVGLLVDQSAGDVGALTLLFDRVCSSTELAGLLATKYNAEVRALYPRRIGFWRVAVETNLIESPPDVTGVTFALNRWLEQSLRDNENLAASWLWSHNRWRTQHAPERRFRIEQKRNFLADELAARGLDALPRRTRIYVRLPNWLGDVVMALPLLRALRAGRPDAAFTLIGKAAFAPLIETAGVAEHYLPLPPRGPGYFRFFRRLRHTFPDTYVLFTNSPRGDLEARLTACPQRFGMLRPGRKRPLLTHAWAAPADIDPTRQHQLEQWTAFLTHFGLLEPGDLRPLGAPSPAPADGPIGLIAGSENLPAKRWPVEHWRALIERFPAVKFELFGTAADRRITTQIAAGFPADRVTDYAGRTDLPAYMARLRSCRLLVSNDTGGLHLANALGVPAIGLFGPTNPCRTKPVFDAPFTLLQPPGCAPTGGGNLADLSPATVANAVEQNLPTATA
mgnify:CR=1 FL=1